MGIIQQNNLKLLNVKISGDNEKIVKFPEDESLATEDWGALSFISEYKSIPLINKVLSDVNLAIAGNFNQIIDAEISNNHGFTWITATGIEFWDDDGYIPTSPLPNLYPLNKFKELLTEWKTFLETRPYDAYTSWG